MGPLTQPTPPPLDQAWHAPSGTVTDGCCSACGLFDHVPRTATSSAGPAGVAALLDRDRTTAWCGPVGSWVEVQLAQPLTVELLSLWPGNQQDLAALARHGRPRTVRVTIGGKSTTVELADVGVVKAGDPPWFERLTWPDLVLRSCYDGPEHWPGTTTTTARITLVAAWPGEAGDVCLSGLHLWAVDELRIEEAAARPENR